MQSKKVKAFKREMENYNFYLDRIKKLDELIEYCYHMLGGVKGIDPSKEPVHAMPNKDVEYKIRDEITRHEKNKELAQGHIKFVDQVLSRINEETKEQIKSVFIDGKSLESVARKNFISKPTLQYRIDKELEKALEY